MVLPVPEVPVESGRPRASWRARIASNEPIVRPPDPLSRTLLVLGAGRRAGQSTVALALCRWLHLQGSRASPFRACAPSRLAVPVDGGGRIARDQLLQALACGIEPRSEMSPILRPGTACDLRRLRPAEAFPDPFGLERARNRLALQSYLHLAGGFDLVVAEASSRGGTRRTGADPFGGISPWWHQGPILIVADARWREPQVQIASIIGRLRPEDRRRLCGIMVNRTGTGGWQHARLLHGIESRFSLPVWGGIPHADWLARGPASPEAAAQQARTAPAASWVHHSWFRWCDRLAGHFSANVRLDWLANRLPAGEAPGISPFPAAPESAGVTSVGADLIKMRP